MKTVVILLAAAIMSGCMSIDYTGKKFPKTGANVIFFAKKSDVPFEKYSIIGRFSVSAKNSTHPYEIEEAVLEKAAKYGADAVYFAGSKFVRYGAYTPNEKEFGAPDPAERKIPEKETELFGSPVPLSSNSANHSRREVQYIVLKNSGEVKRLLGL